jgi:cytochrome P450
MIQILAKRPELQTLMQKEIDRAIGSTRQPTLADRKLCPLVEAVTLETLRYISHTPVSQHCTSQDTNIFGVPINKNTQVCPF